MFVQSRHSVLIVSRDLYKSGSDGFILISQQTKYILNSFLLKLII